MSEHDQYTFDQPFTNEPAIDVAAQPDTQAQEPVEQPPVINGAALGERVDGLQYESMPGGHIDQKKAKAQAKIEQLEADLAAVQEKIKPWMEQYVTSRDKMALNHKLLNDTDALKVVKKFSIDDLEKEQKLHEEYDKAFKGKQAAASKLHELQYIEEQLQTKLGEATRHERQLSDLQPQIRQALGKLAALALELDELPEAEDMPAGLTDAIQLPNIVADEADISAYIKPIMSDGREVELTASQAVPLPAPAVPEVQAAPLNGLAEVKGLFAPLPNVGRKMHGKKPKMKKSKQHQIQ